ncbi:hypothetical protein DINM_004507 [Dirofilaria immitis]|nr:hypothetical protein [Dirofilaria immitis]
MLTFRNGYRSPNCCSGLVGMDSNKQSAKRASVALHLLVLIIRELQYGPREQFNETIFRLISLKFDLDSGDIDRIIRFPLIGGDPDQMMIDSPNIILIGTNLYHPAFGSSGAWCEVFGFILFTSASRSCYLAKNRLDPPTTVDPITEPPKELSGEAEFETVAAPANLEMAGEHNSNLADTVDADTDSGAQSAIVTGIPNIPVTPVASEQDDVVVAPDDDDTSRPIAGKNGKNGWPLTLLAEVKKPLSITVPNTDWICLVISDHSKVITACF